MATRISPSLQPWYRNAGKLVTAAASTGAALVSIMSFLYSYGVVGESESHQTIGNLGAAWVGLRPAADTASAIGDTLHLAATITDKNGAVLVGARPTWATDNDAVATVLPDGSVIARGPGRTTVVVTVGKLVARSRIIVRQQVQTVSVGAPGDSVVMVPEDSRRPLFAFALDARGHRISGAHAAWAADDTAIVAVDSTGAAIGRSPGRAVVSATIAGVTGHTAVTVVPAPALVVPVAGAAQRAPAGATLSHPVTVRVTSSRGRPVSGVLVTFRPDRGGDTEPKAMLTDADGRARASWTLGPLPGKHTLVAVAAGVDTAATVVAEADPNPATTRVVAAVDTALGASGAALEQPVAVRVTDTTGVALADVPVSWVTLDGGAVEPIDARTDTTGMARARWTLGPRAGLQRLRAQAGAGHGSGAIRPVTLAARAMPGAPVTVAATSGDRQRATVGARLARPIVVRVLDARGNGVPGVPLSLVASAGTVGDSIPRTDSTGAVAVRWTLGRTAGEQTLAVRVKEVPAPLKLSARAQPGAPANLSFDDGEGAAKGSRTRRLVAIVTDEYGNPVADARVRFSATTGGVQPARAVSDAKGRASVVWTPGTKGGEQTLTGAVTGSDAKGSFVATLSGSGTSTKTAASSTRPGTSRAKAPASGTRSKAPVRASAPAPVKRKAAPTRG